MCYNFAYLMHTRFSYIHSRLPVLYTLSTCFVWVPVQIFGYGILVEIETSFRNEVLKNCRFFSKPQVPAPVVHCFPRLWGVVDVFHSFFFRCLPATRIINVSGGIPNPWFLIYIASVSHNLLSQQMNCT